MNLRAPPPGSDRAPPREAATRRDLVVLSIIVLAPLVLFADKPVHVDDPLFLWSAQQIRRDPADFFGFPVNWNGTLQPFAEVTKNPPLACYLLAGCSLVAGWNEIGLHCAFSGLAVITAIGMYALARRFCRHPLCATCIAVGTPAFLVTGTTLMGDMLLLACWCWAIEFWWRGLDTGRTGDFVAAGLCTAAAVLSKYFGVALFPLLACLTLVRPGAKRHWLAWLAIPLLIVAGYEWYGYAKYDRVLIADAIFYASKAQYDTLYVPLAAKAAGSVIYVGGCFVTALLLAPFVWSLRTLAVLAIATLVSVGILVAVGHLRELPIRQAAAVDGNAVAHLAVFALAGIQLLALVTVDAWRHPRWDTLVLVLCFAGTWLFAAGVNWTINARSLLTMSPVVGILVVRQLEHRFGAATWGNKVAWSVGILSGCAVAGSLVVAWGDYRTAVATRHSAEAVGRQYAESPRTLRFQGHWGFQYYLQRYGAKAADYESDTCQAGDLLAVPKFGNLLRPPTAEQAKLIDTVAVPYDCDVATVGMDRQALFYAQAAFPFRLIDQPPAECLIYQFR